MHLFFVTFREPPGSWMSNIQPRLAEAQRTKVIEAVVGKGVNLTQAPLPVVSSRGIVVDSDMLPPQSSRIRRGPKYPLRMAEPEDKLANH